MRPSPSPPPTDSTLRSRFAVLQHPVFVAALFVLLLNDHVLKSAVPGWFTGKLSDFAGLIVAPCLFAAILGAGPRRRIVAFVAAVLPFVAINLFPTAARAMETATGALGVGWTIFTDPTDLIGLIVLPLSWCLLETKPEAARPVLEKTVLVVAAFACMATSLPPPLPGTHRTSAYVLNDTGEEIEVRVRHLDGALDCTLAPEHLEEALSARSFGDPLAFRLAPGQVLPLERDAIAADRGPEGLDCDAVLIDVGGNDKHVVFYDTVRRDVSSVIDTTNPDAPRDGEVTLLGTALAPMVEFRAPIQAHTLRSEAPLASCASDPLTAGWSTPPLYGSERAADLPEFEVVEAEVAADGCQRLGLQPPAVTPRLDESVAFAGPDPEPFYVCLPPRFFRFLSGDRIRVSATQLEIDRDGVIDVVERLTLARGSRLALATTASASPDRVVATAEPLTCGERLRCGAYRRHAAVQVFGEELRIGEQLILEDASGRTAIIALDAGVVTVSNHDCEDASELGSRIELLVHRDYFGPGDR
ncbi:MAG: hypothetical protein AAGF12_30895 [Myxococcota bacterium]